MDWPERLIYIASVTALTVLAFRGLVALGGDADAAPAVAVLGFALFLALVVSPLAFEWRRDAIKRKSFDEGRAAGLAEAKRRREEA